MSTPANQKSPKPLHAVLHHAWSLPLVLLLFSPVPAAAGLITGTIRYEDMLYDYDGVTGYTEYKPARLAEVEVVESGTELILGSSATNLAGRYRILIPSAGNSDLRVRCYARNTSGTVNAVVKNKVSQQAIYTAVSSTVNVDTAGKASIDIDIPISAAAGAFNILDTAVRAALFMQPYVHNAFPLLTFYWEDGSNDGTYYDPYDGSIHLLGKSADPDEFDDDIILHEVGHYICGNFSRDDSPGGPHSLTGRYVVTLTWSEGWAHFFSSAVRNEGWQIDVRGTYASRWNLETPSWESQARGADNEIAVAAVLWDLYDSSHTPDGLSTGDDDHLSLNFEEIWHLMSGWMKDDGDAELHLFWMGWDDELVPLITSQPELQTIFADRHISYVDDAFEPNDPYTEAAEILTTGETHFGTLTSPDDRDWYIFRVLAGETYMAVLTDIRSGGYAKMRLYDEAGALLDEATNPSIGSAAQILWTPDEDSWHYVRIEPANQTQAATYLFSISGPLADGPIGNSGPDDYGDDTYNAHQILADGSEVSGSIETPGDADAFAFPLEKGWTYAVSVAAVGDNYAELTLYDDNPAIFAAAAPSGGSDPTDITFYCARDGTYFARIHHSDRQSGILDYSISVTPHQQPQLASPAVLNLTPADGTSVDSSTPPTFRWAARDLIAYRVRFSRYQGDPLAIVFPFSHTGTQMLTPNHYQWDLLTTLASEGGGQLYWSVSPLGAQDSTHTYLLVLP